MVVVFSIRISGNIYQVIEIKHFLCSFKTRNRIYFSHQVQVQSQPYGAAQLNRNV